MASRGSMDAGSGRFVLICAALFVLTLTFASRAEAFVYWANQGTNTIGRANLDGNPASVDSSFIDDAGFPCGVAVDGAHVYWGNDLDGKIGRANLDGSGVDPNFITGLGSPCGVAVNSTHLFGADFFANTIGRAN